MEHSVSLQNYNGAISLFIDGKVQNFTHFKVNESAVPARGLEIINAEMPGIAARGINICWIPVFIDWKARGVYDFTKMDEKINAVLGNYEKYSPPGSPEVAVVIRLQAGIFFPEWYVRGHMVDGKYTNMVKFRNLWGPSEPTEIKWEQRYCTRNPRYGEPFAVSPGDKFWDTDALDCLQAIIDHAKSQPYHKHIFGYLHCALSTNEWFLHSDSPHSCCDFSAPMQRRFFDYLQEKGIDCSYTPVPTPSECFDPDPAWNPMTEVTQGLILDQEKDADFRLEEFSLFLNSRIADIIENFSRKFKANYKEKNKLVGCFYGYTTEMSPINNLAQCGHIALRRLMQSPYIDFFCSPLQYRYRWDDLPFTYSQVCGAFADSMRLYGKLTFGEEDNAAPMSAMRRDSWHDEMFHLRDFAATATHGQHQWWYSLGYMWYKDPVRQDLIAKLHRIAQQAMEMDRSPVAEVAVIADERSISALKLDPVFWKQTMLDTCSHIYPSGTPFDFFELKAFMDKADKKQYKAVVFLNLFRTDAEVEKQINSLKNNGRTLIFLSLAGMAFDDAAGKRTVSAENSSRLTGMKMKICTEKLPNAVWIDPDRNDFAGGEDLRFGTDIWLDKLQCVADEEAEAIGFARNGEVNFARRKFDSWTSVFISAPLVPGKVWRRLFQEAGVHCYAQCGDVAYANASMVCYSSSSYGTKTLEMPGAEKLTDVMTGETVELDSQNRCSFHMRRHEVKVFFRSKK